MEPKFRDSNVARAMTVGQEVIDRKLVLEGAFNEEIARLKALSAECDAKMGVVKTLKAAEEVKADAVRYARDAKLLIDQVTKDEHTKATRIARDLDARGAALDTQAADLDSREQALKKAKDAVDRAALDTDTKNAQAAAALLVATKKADERAAALDAREYLLDDREGSLDARERKLAAQLSAVSRITV